MVCKIEKEKKSEEKIFTKGDYDLKMCTQQGDTPYICEKCVQNSLYYIL